MRHGHLADHRVGEFRPALGWVRGRSPADAAYVPPPPSEIPRLVEDLIAFVDARSGDFDAVSRVALVHAQFEAIHPYGDGNGRLGRMLVSPVLRGGDATARSTAPISAAMARDPGGYLSGLHLFQHGDLRPLGQVVRGHRLRPQRQPSSSWRKPPDSWTAGATSSPT